jgi:hypothetical protein
MNYHNQHHLIILLVPKLNKIFKYIIMGFTKFLSSFNPFFTTRRRKRKTRRQKKHKRTRRNIMRGG